MGSQLPPPKKGTASQFSVHVYCGQTAGWMKTPLGMEVDLGPGTLYKTGSQLSAKGAQQPPPFFSAHVCCGHNRPSPLLLSSSLQYSERLHSDGDEPNNRSLVSVAYSCSCHDSNQSLTLAILCCKCSAMVCTCEASW